MRSEPSEPDFTPQETQVLKLMADGMTSRAIAAKLGISRRTADAHIGSILWRLRNRPDEGKDSV
jgi:DNA-binding CsgD family transcriptional regulator